MGYGTRFLRRKKDEEPPKREKQRAEEIYGMPEGADLTRHLQNMGKLPKAQGENSQAKTSIQRPAKIGQGQAKIQTQPQYQGYYQNKQDSRENRAAQDNARRLKEMQAYRKQLSDRLYAPNSWDEKQIASQGAESWRRDVGGRVESLDQRIQAMKQRQKGLEEQKEAKRRLYQSPEVQKADAQRRRQKALDRDRETRLSGMEKAREEIRSRTLYPTREDLAEIDRIGREAWRQELQKDLDYLDGAIGKMKDQKGPSNQETYRQLKQAQAAELEDVLLAPDAEETIAKATAEAQRQGALDLLGKNFQQKRTAKYLADPAFRAKGQTGAPSIDRALEALQAWAPLGSREKRAQAMKRLQEEPQSQTLANRDSKEDLDFLTDQEKQTLLYYAGKGDWATMAQYYDAIERQAQQRRQEYADQWAEDLANRHKLAGTALNIGASLFSPLAYAETLKQTLTNKITGEDAPINTASPLTAGARLAEAAQKGITRDMGPVGQFLTSTGLSIGQNLARMPLGPGAALGSMALGAAGGASLGAAERGASAGQAATLGALSGAAEALTEKIPLDNLFRLAREGGGEGLKGFLRAALGQMGSEAAEETISEYANRLADNIVMSEQSEMERYIRQLMDQGAGEEEAKKAAAQEFWVKQPALAGLGGALSGGVMGGGAQVLNRMNSFLQGPQEANLPKALEQGTMDQNEQEAARRRFLRKEVADEAERGYDAGRERSLAQGGGEESGLRGLPPGRGRLSSDYHSNQRTAELETLDPRGEGRIERIQPKTEKGFGRISSQERTGQQSGGFREEKIGDYIYRYQEARQEEIAPRIRQAQEEFRQRGVKSIVVDGEVTAEQKGRISTSRAAAFVRADGSVVISKDAVNSGLIEQIVPHESLHSVKKTNPQRYRQLEDRIYDLDINIMDESEVLKIIKQAYGYDDFGRENSRLLEEVLTQLAGWHSEDPAFAREKFGPLFVDYDGVIAELEGLDAELLAQNQRDGFLQGPQGASLPKELEQGTMEQNEQEAARRRFLRKEVAGGGQHKGIQQQPNQAFIGQEDYNGQENQARGDGGTGRRLQGYQSGGEGLRQSQSFREAIGAFTHRAAEEGKSTETYGETAIAYRRTEPQAITQRTKEIQEFLQNHGAEAQVVDSFERNIGDQTHTTPEAVSDGTGKVYLINGTEGNALEVGGHELCHIAENEQKASRFVAATSGESQDIFSETYIHYIASIIESYFDDRGRTYDPSNPSHVEQVQREFRAYVAGALTADEAGARIEFADCFSDMDEVAAGWREALINTDRKATPGQSRPGSNDDILALTRKGSEYLSRAERQAADTIAKAMNIPKWAKREKLGPAVRQLAERLTQDGRISAEAADSAFEAAYEQGLIVLDDFAGQYADLKRELRRTRFQLSEQDKADLGDYGDFRRRNMGRLNIVNQGGIPVDVKYQELTATYPELFDPQITHPADQLLAIEEIRNQMDETELSLDQYYGPEAEQYKEFARYEFDRAMEKLGDEAAYVRRYEEDRARKNRKTEAPEADIQTIKEAYARNRQLTRASEKAAGKYLLTEGDRRQIDRLLKEEIRPEELPQGANRQGILEVYQARKAQRDNMEPVRQYRRQVKELYRQRALELAEGADGWKDKKIGLAYSRETAERNMTDIMGKEQARAMIDEYFWPIHREEAEKTRLKNQLRDRIRDLKLSQKAQYQITYQDPTNGAPVSGKVSESALVQLLGENVVGLEAVRASGADAAKIQRAADAFRQTYDELFGMAEEALIRNGYPPPGYIEGYFPHFQNNKPDGFFARIRNAAGFGLEEGGLPTEIAGQTHTFKPGKKWFGNFLERTGTGTEYDALKGFDRYLEGITDVIYHTDNIQRLRGLESALRYKFSDEGARAEIDQTRGDRQLDEQTREAMLEQLYSRNKSQLPGLVTWLRNYTDILAGKKHPSDRQAEHELGRRIYEISKKLEGRVAANMVGGNIASASTNFIPLTQAWGRLKTRSLLGGIYDTIRYHSGGDGFVDGSTFLTNRRGSEPLSLSKLDKAGAKASILMELIDNFTSEAITRARYAENLEDGLDLSAAMKDADEWTAGLMADRSKGSMPTMFEQKNPLIKTLNMFQLEVNNQLSYLFKDMPREAKEKGGLALALWMTKMFLGAWLYNEAAERITGRRPALDPADMIWQAYQDFADPDTKASEALGNLGKSATEQLPFIGGLMGGGRLPISSALPDLTQLAKLADRDAAPEKKKEIAKKELLYKPGAYLAMPFGGGQLKKSAEAFQTLARGGSYARNNKGEEQLRFLANGKKPSAWIKGLAFGQYSLPEAQDYAAGGFKTLSAKQTKTVEEARKRGMDPQAVVDLIGRLKQAQAEKNDAGETVRTENQVKRRMIRETEFSAEEKSWLDTQLLSDGFFMKKEIAADYSSEAALKLSEYGTGVQDKAREAEKAGVSPEIFLAAYEAQKGMESDKGKDGQPIPLSKMKKRKAAIDQAAPGLSPTQRNQVYEILGISAKAR